MEALSEAERMYPEEHSTHSGKERIISAVSECGGLQRHQQRRRTVFTEKQLEDLKLLFRKNPYPEPTLKQQLATKMNMHPTVLQVWFKNQRAKLKKANNHTHRTIEERPPPLPPPPPPPLSKLTEVETRMETETETEAETKDKAQDKAPTSPPWGATEGPPPDAHPVALICTGHALPSFQLSICPPHLHAGGHKVVHFGCCQDPMVYCMHPILGAQGAPAPALPPAAPCGSREAR